MTALVLLSGGMDSATCLFWAAENLPPPIYGLTFSYSQQAAVSEINAATSVWASCKRQHQSGTLKDLQIVTINSDVFGGLSSILGRSKIDHYKDQNQAIENTNNDRAYLPFRNAIFISIAAHWLLTYDNQGTVVIGVRGRINSTNPGFPDCTNSFVKAMSNALSKGSFEKVKLLDPLNIYAPTRSATIAMAQQLPGCFEVLAHTVSCFSGTKCGRCLPCLRRAQAFADLMLKDPAC